MPENRDVGPANTRTINVSGRTNYDFISQGIRTLGNVAMTAKQQDIESDFRDDLQERDLEYLNTLQNDLANRGEAVTVDSETPIVDEFMKLVERNEAGVRQGSMTPDARNLRNSTIISDYIARYPGLADRFVTIAGQNSRFSDTSIVIQQLEAIRSGQAQADANELDRILKHADQLGVDMALYSSPSEMDRRQFFTQYRDASADAAIVAKNARDAAIANAADLATTQSIKASVREVMPSLIKTAFNTGQAYMQQFMGVSSQAELVRQIQSDPTMFEQAKQGYFAEISNMKAEIQASRDPKGLVPQEDWNKAWGMVDSLAEMQLAMLGTQYYDGLMKNVDSLSSTLQLQQVMPQFTAILQLATLSEKLASHPGMKPTAVELGKHLNKGITDYLAVLSGWQATGGGGSTSEGTPRPSPGSTLMSSNLETGIWRDFLPDDVAQRLDIQLPKEAQDTLINGLPQGNREYTKEEEEAAKNQAAIQGINMVDAWANTVNINIQRGEFMMPANNVRESILSLTASDEFKEYSQNWEPWQLQNYVSNVQPVLLHEAVETAREDFAFYLEPYLREANLPVEVEQMSNTDKILAVMTQGYSGQGQLGSFASGTQGVDADTVRNVERIPNRDVIEVVFNREDGSITFQPAVPEGVEVNEAFEQMLVETTAHFNSTVAPKITKMVRTLAHIMPNGTYEMAGAILISEYNAADEFVARFAE